MSNPDGSGRRRIQDRALGIWHLPTLKLRQASLALGKAQSPRGPAKTQEPRPWPFDKLPSTKAQGLRQDKQFGRLAPSPQLWSVGDCDWWRKGTAGVAIRY